MANILITGYSGLLGRSVLELLKNSHHSLVLAGRNHTNKTLPFQNFDLNKDNEELDLKEIDVVLHLASDTSDLKSGSDINGINKILAAAKRDGLKKLVYISIVGVDRVPIKYYKTKFQVEQLIRESGINFNILRATQFLEFFEKYISNAIKKKIVILPNLIYQPIETKKVAEKLIELIEDQRKNLELELGGSTMLSFSDAIAIYKLRKKLRKRIVFLPGFILGKIRTALTTESKVEDGMTWEEYLDSTIS